MDYYFYDYETIVPDDNERSLYKFTEKDMDEVWHNCIQPSFDQIIQYVVVIISWNFTFRFLLWTLWMITRRNIQYVQQVISIICGGSVIYVTVGESVYYLLCFTLIGYFILIILRKYHTPDQTGSTILGISLTFLVLCEILYDDPKVWHRIRGIQMISAMKTISIAFDLDRRKITQMPNIFQYLGYIFCPANCSLGPWVPFQEYMSALNGPALRVRWIGWAFLNGFVSVIFLICSNCLVAMLCSDLSLNWIVAYRDALAFRCSHYFISFLSQATMCAAGFVKEKDRSKYFGVLVTKPSEIECPRSLVTVVTNWNIPMHIWLKAYVFKPMKPRGTGIAILATYIVSSLLHGINPQIYLVLLSLGAYTFMEFRWRQKISFNFDACVLSTRCKETCSHTMTNKHSLGILFNTVFGLLAVINLAYLGVMFENSSNFQDEGYSFWYALRKWENLSYFGHLMIIGGYIGSFMI